MFFVSLIPSGGDFDEAGNAPGPERKIRSIVTWRVLFWRVCNLKRTEIGNLSVWYLLRGKVSVTGSIF